MQNKEFIDLQINKKDFTSLPFEKGTYEACNFIECNFSESDLSKIEFIDCKFTQCNLSMSNIMGTSFKDIVFQDCNLLGLHFDECNPFLLKLQFKNCLLQLSFFYQLNLKGTQFEACNLQEVDFTETNLTNSNFINCDLNRAIFDQTNLSNADLSDSNNFSIDPERNILKGAIFSSHSLLGLLHKYQIEVI